MNTKKSIWLMFFLSSLFFNTERANTTGNGLKKIKQIVAKGGKVSNSKATADLGLELSVDNVNAYAGEVVVFTIIVTNYGPDDATGVQVTDKLPGGYTYIDSSTLIGSYNDSTGLWTIGSIANGKSAILTIKAMVNGGGDHMDLAEVTACDQQDPDSKPGDGVDTDHDNQVVDDPDDDDDGDGQDLKSELSEGKSSAKDNYGKHKKQKGDSSTTTIHRPVGIKAFLKDHKGETQTYVFDGRSVAMRVEFDPKEKQMPMYFDNAGYVYTASKKKTYVKVPFEKLKKLMKFRTFVSGGVLPPIDFPDGSITYYGMDVSPKRFPILEWAFVYKTSHFEGNPDFNKETLVCRGEANCVKYILKAGKDAGSYVLFDAEGRLAEIFSINSGNAVYTYEDNTVELPAAREMPFMSNIFSK